MKRLAAIILSTLLLFSAFVGCDTSDNNSIENQENKYTFISSKEKNTWRDKLINVLSNCDIYGSFAVGLMDLNFDNSPEVLIAYPGGSMGNVFTTFYELDTGEKLFIYDADHWDSGDNMNLCVAEDCNGEPVILSEGCLLGKIDIGYTNYIRVFPKYVDFYAPVLYPNNFLAKSTDSDSHVHYYYKDREVDKSEYEAHTNDYKRIASTQIQLITHEIIGKDSEINTDPDARRDFAEKMADALINSSQEFIDYNSSGITMSKYPYVQNMYHPILDAYIKMATHRKTEGSIDGIVIADYPELSSENFEALLKYTEECHSYGRGFFLYDINRDGTEEMVFSSWGGGLSQYYIEMIFTGDGNEAKLIGRFSDNDYNHITQIGDDGRIHCSIAGKGEGGTSRVVSFDKTGATEIFSYGISDYTGFYDCEIEWFKEENGEWVNITEKEYLLLEEAYAFNEIKTGFEFRYFFKFAPK
ncbi:MAG: hypothetical protein IJD74_00270 [Clostridia bacterium]|nr:hypothetical protein [Clostridia bacterium]